MHTSRLRIIADHRAPRRRCVECGGLQTGEDTGPPAVIVVQNWFEELRRLVPTN